MNTAPWCFRCEYAHKNPCEAEPSDVAVEQAPRKNYAEIDGRTISSGLDHQKPQAVEQPESIPDYETVEYWKERYIEVRREQGHDERLRECLRNLVGALDAAEPGMLAAFQMQQLHGTTYRGPTYEAELKAAREALALPNQERDSNFATVQEPNGS